MVALADATLDVKKARRPGLDRRGRVSRLGRVTRSPVWGFAIVVVALLPVALFAGSGVAQASPQMTSTGSSFAGVAITNWVGQAATLYGLAINWQTQSSVIGLDEYAQNEIDFGASDIPYSSGQATSSPTAPYQYMPDVAGALAFMYNLKGVNGNKINNLILNGEALEDIFTGRIDTWNNPVIAQINPQLAGDLPDTKISFVYRADAAGENYLLSDYFLHLDPQGFTQYEQTFGTVGQGAAGVPTATWPTWNSGMGAVPPGYPGWNNNPYGAQGADAAADFVASSADNGSIAYVETAYAIEYHSPVASVVNASGNAVQPTSVNDAIALEKAILYSDLTQNLQYVYTNPLPQAYPISSYSYFVTPCTPALAAAQKFQCTGPGGSSPFNSAKGQALGQFIQFVACAGQQNMATLGYSPLPPNLVQEDFNAIGRLNGGQQPPPVSAQDCRNPYVDGQTPLPGEPTITGQSNPGNLPVASSSTSGGGSSGGAAAAGGAGSSGSSASGSAGSSGSGANGSSAAAGSAAAQQAAQNAFSGHAKNAGSASGLSGFEHANGVTDFAFSTLKDFSAAGVIAIWCLVLAAVIAGPPLVVWWRRRFRSAKAK